MTALAILLLTVTTVSIAALNIWYACNMRKLTPEERQREDSECRFDMCVW